jgi:hypothetical protein
MLADAQGGGPTPQHPDDGLDLALVVDRSCVVDSTAGHVDSPSLKTRIGITVTVGSVLDCVN